MRVLTRENKVNKVIPDSNAEGLTNVMEVQHKGKIQNIKVGVDITHSYIGDLAVELTAPSGDVIKLHERAGGSGNDLKVTYEGEILEPLIGKPVKGKWKLNAKDFAPKDEGKLNSWNIVFTYSEPKNTKSEIVIPDEDEEGLLSKQLCRFNGIITDINMMVEIEHSYIGDLKVAITSPAGTTVSLHERTGGSTNNLKKTYDKEALAAFVGENCKGVWTLQAVDYAPKDTGVLKHWSIDLKYKAKDDLKKVEGIGPKIEELLNNAGIHTWTALSASSPTRLKSILEAAGDRYKMHNPDTWPAQALMAAQGKWTELQKWQDELDGGRMN